MSDINGEDSGDVLPSGNQDLNNLPEEILDKMGSLRESGTTTDNDMDKTVWKDQNPEDGDLATLKDMDKVSTDVFGAPGSSCIMNSVDGDLEEVDSDTSDGDNLTTGVSEQLETGAKRKERSDENLQVQYAGSSCIMNSVDGDLEEVDSDTSDVDNPTTCVSEELETGVKRKERSDEDFQTRKAPRIDDWEYWMYPDFMDEGEVRHRDGEVIRLREIFPEISLSYADRCCKRVKTIDDFNNLILDLSQRDLSKEEGGKSSRKNAFDAEEDMLVSMMYESSVTNEQFDTLLHIFPDADPANLVEVCNTCAGSQREFKTIVTNLVNFGKA